MSSFLDRLLAADSTKLTTRPSKRVRLKRLEKLLGGECEIELFALTMKEIDALPNDDSNEHTIIKSAKNMNFGDPALCEKLKPEGRGTPLLPTEVVKAIFLPGEIAALGKMVLEVSGFGASTLETIEKN